MTDMNKLIKFVLGAAQVLRRVILQVIRQHLKVTG